jgi:hypothetical protein
VKSGLPDMTARDPDGLSRIFRYFAEVETPRMDSPVYTDYCFGVSTDDPLLALCAQINPGQPAPNILFASVQDLLLKDPAGSPEAEALCVFYPAISGRPIPDESAWESFRAFCQAHADELGPNLRSGRTQTCVVHRSTVILPALATLPQIEANRGRVGLLEIGPSVGLNLRLDRYRYEYGNGVAWGEASARPKLICETRGDRAPPMPARLEVVARRGLELNRIDPSNPAEIRWLRALIWPEHSERAKVMDEAIAHAKTVPVEIEEGDATREIAAQLARLPSDAARIVFATHVFYQISREGRRRIHDGIASASREQPVDLILMESSGEGDSQLWRFRFESGERTGRSVLARSDSHGRWIEWGAQ